MKSYASVADLKAELGIPTATTDHDNALGRALVGASRWIDLELGNGDAADDAWTGDHNDIVLVTTPAAALVDTCLYVAVRFYKAPSVPYGVAGMSDQGLVAYVRQSMPEASIMLMGQHEQWGIA